MVNSGEVQEVAYSNVVGGDPVPWKISMWGSAIDAKVLQTVERNFRTVGNLEDSGQLIISQGPELRGSVGERNSNEYHPELVSTGTIDTDSLRRLRYLLRFPEGSIRRLTHSEVFVNKRAGIKKKLSICRPPHVIVSASRNFAVYSGDSLVVPARQIGITSPSGERSLLKAIALYLNSDFVTYHQFLTRTESGVQKTRNTLKALRSIPLPFDATTTRVWEDLYSRIAHESIGRDDFDRPDLVEELNDLTSVALKLSPRSRSAVADLVRIRFGLNQGKMEPSAVGPPPGDELLAYGRALEHELNDFVGQSSSTRHRIDILVGSESGMVAVELVAEVDRPTVSVWAASDSEAQQLAETRQRLMEPRAQWLYFNRNLRVYEGSRTYLLKPLQRFHWTRTQAAQDAAEIIADCLEPDAGVPSRTLN